MRNENAKLDPARWSDSELLEVLLGTRRTGEQLLHQHGNLRALLLACSHRPPGQTAPRPRLHTARRLQAALELAERHFTAAVQAGDSLGSPADTARFLTAKLRDRPFELFCCLHLDTRHRLIAYEELFRGTVDGASVHPREVVRQALIHNSSALIFAHNHPSGVAEPSRADELITLRLRDALALVEVRVLDHLIVAGPQVVSLAERGLL